MLIEKWPFDVSPAAAVVTTSHVTLKRLPILFATHERDAEAGVIWQFHCDNDDYDESVLQFVRLDELLAVDPELVKLADLPLGFAARRASAAAAWTYERESR